MKRDIPIFSYDDAWQFLCHDDDLNGVVIDAASEEVMLRIEAATNRLKVMGDDDRRYFWIWAQKNSHEREWLKIVTAHFKDFHYLILGNGKFKSAVFQNAESIYHNDEKYRQDMLQPLLALEKHVLPVVDWICESPKEYNAYVERYLPYHKRSGDIPRRVLYSLLPGKDQTEERERLIRGLEEVKSSEPSTFGEITLRTYIHVWSSAYRVLAQLRAGRDDDWYNKKRMDDAREMADVELFRRYNNKGHQIDGLNLDTQEDYEKWYAANSSYHCMDVAYARIHLHPWKEKDEESYRFHLYFCVYGFYDDVVEIAIELHKQGIDLIVDEMESILKILRQEDMVGFRPWPDKYMDRDGVTNQVWLPYIGDVSKEVYWKIIKNTTWHKQKKVWPCETI